jgi:hypothetical protein
VPFVTICNPSNLDAAMGGGALDLIEVQLWQSVVPRRWNHADAAAFLRTSRR